MRDSNLIKKELPSLIARRAGGYAEELHNRDAFQVKSVTKASARLFHITDVTESYITKITFFCFIE